MNNLNQISFDVQAPASTGQTVLRSLDANASYNKNVTSKMTSSVSPVIKGENNILSPDFQTITNIDELRVALSQVLVRFDNDPRMYTKKDYYYLLMLISRSLVYLYEENASDSKDEELQNQITDLKIQLDQLLSEYNKAVPVINGLVSDVEELKTANESEIEHIHADIQENRDDIDDLRNKVDVTENQTARLEETVRLLEKAIEQLGQSGTNSEDVELLKQTVAALISRVEALEKEECHEHANKEVLDSITAEQVASWNAAETNAKAYTDEQIEKIQIPSLEGYATEEWVQSQGYLTKHQDISDLATKAEVASVQEKVTANAEAIATLNGTGEGSVTKTVNDAIASVIASAPEDFDTLKEIADYIANDQTGAAELANRVTVLEEEVENLKNTQPGLPDTPEQVSITAGSGIEISEVEESSQISAVWTEEPLKVQVNVGGYSPEDQINTGDDLISIIKKLLTKFIGVTVKEPSVRISGSIAAVEYGETTADSAITVNLTDGQFVSADAANYPMDPVSLGCSLSNTVVKNGSVEVATSETNKVTVPGFVLTEPTTLTVYTDISASTNTAKNNDGTVSDASYSGVTSKQAGSLKVTPFYKIFMGSVAKDTELTADIIRGLSFEETIGYSESTKTFSSSYAFTSGDIIITCPSKFVLSEIKQVETGGSYLTKFENVGAAQLLCGSTTCDYTIYKYQSGVEFNFNNITFKKQ